ncbi:hypothetical protein BMW23_0221 [Bodo saltans virus]|uniref:Uncharacterized protein n=1 Tax=Bodo saltans virus TaxID=2024608 RepID=A0A2H4UTW6_9VIRU|nr:hypothetical protein QJ851_gp0216 [Bodo saltans virus]ATZ80279.1 hypothetical protein BMW23_0221 [Bodo saltans virus]
MHNIYLIVYIISQIITGILFRIITVIYGDAHAFFQTQFMNLFFIIFGFMILLPLQYNYITKEYRKWEYHKTYFITSIFDSLSSYLLSITGMYVSGDYQIILHVLTFILSIFVTPIIFRKKYEQIKYCFKYNNDIIAKYIIGILLLFAGIYICLQTELQHNNNVVLINIIIFGFAQIATVPASLMKEEFLNKKDTSIIHLTVWNSVYIFLLTNLFLPLQIISFLGNIPPSMLIEKGIYDGINCFMGTTPQCKNANYILIIYSFFIFVEYMLVNLFNRESTSYMYGINIVVIPLTIFCFGLPILGTGIYQPLSGYIICSIIFVIMGIKYFESSERELNNIDVDILREYTEV